MRFLFCNKNYIFLKIFILIFLSSSVLLAEAKEQKYNFTYKNVDIEKFIRDVSRILEKNIIFDESIKGKKISVITPYPIGKDEVYKTFVSLLQMEGFCCISEKEFIKIIPISRTRGKGAFSAKKGIATVVIHIENLKLSSVFMLARSLLTKIGVITKYPDTNTIVVSDTVENIIRIKDVIEELEKEYLRKGEKKREINVYFLKNSKAISLSQTLKKITSGTRFKIFESPISITPDKATNSLIILASSKDYKKILPVIEKLDIKRRQVYVEAAVLEISSNKLKELGFSFRSVENISTNKVRGFGSTNLGHMNEVITGPLALANVGGFSVGVVKGVFTLNGVEYLNVGALLHALESSSEVNVLSTPNLLTLDNEQAEIQVGKNLPFITGQSQSVGGNVLTTIERRNVGITLKITPHIVGEKMVRLDIYQEISSLTVEPTINVNILGPTINKRATKTSVLVNDGQTVVIGGLVQRKVNIKKEGVPLLSKIPLLGYLFRYKKVTHDKTNLLVFLTPRIITESKTIKSITGEKKKEIEEKKEKELDKG